MGVGRMKEGERESVALILGSLFLPPTSLHSTVSRLQTVLSDQNCCNLLEKSLHTLKFV